GDEGDAIHRLHKSSEYNVEDIDRRDACDAQRRAQPTGNRVAVERSAGASCWATAGRIQKTK
ncbi:MAG: hypothetical protein MN733_42150, partial [Nitrososphaera sp.]|nr:hypothetical protein [Nitrososphaera sp.]